MKFRNLNIILVLLSVLLVALQASPCYARKTVTFLVEENCPYSCDPEKESGKKGFVQDILTTIFNKNGYDTDFMVVPWLRALSIFNNRTAKVDAITGMKIHPVNKKMALFPEEEIACYTHRFYAIKDSDISSSWKYQGVKSLENYIIGCVKGWSYCDKDISEYLQQSDQPNVAPMHGKAAENKNLKRLLKGRIQLWAADINNTEYLLNKERKAGNRDVENIIRLSDMPITNEIQVYPIFYNCESGKKYAAIFSKGMQDLRRSGGLAKLLAKYGLKDWHSSNDKVQIPRL